MLFALVLGCKSHAGKIYLAAAGLSDYSIVIPVNYTKKEQKAASIIADYFKKVTGASIAILPEDKYKGFKAIYVGQTSKHNPLAGDVQNGESLLISTTKKEVFIKGGSGQGIIYAAYTFVEKYLGCRKYDEGPAICPHINELALQQDLVDSEAPGFVYRQSYYPASVNAEYLQWHKLQKFEDLWGLWGHSFFKIIPEEQYFNTHPEYFSEIDGRRVAKQLCLSNPDVLKLTIEYFKTAISAHPDAIYWSLSQNDGGGFCTCEQCRKIDEAAGSQQGSLIKFVNKVAEKFPNKIFTTLAYGYSEKPPVNIKPATNVFVMLSTINAERQQPLENNATATKFRTNLTGWQKITDNIYIWDYTTQFTNYLAPFPDYINIQANIEYFKRSNVKGVFFQGSGEGYSDMAELNSYLQSELLWNPNIDAAEEMHQFIFGYYGNAGRYIEEYINVLNQNVKKYGAKLDIYGNPVNNYADYLSPALLKSYSNLFNAAELAVKGNRLLEERVKRARLSLNYTLLQQAKLYPDRESGYLVNEGGKTKVKPGWIEMVTDFVELCKSAGVLSMAEDYSSPDNYLNIWKTQVDNSQHPNLAAGAKVLLNSEYSEDYPANGDKTLTDGIFGTLDFSFNWLFVYGQDLKADIELGTSKTFKHVSINFLNDPKHYIFLPTAVKVMISDDGVKYKLFNAEKACGPSGRNLPEIKNVLLTDEVKARYIRIEAKCLSKLPAAYAPSTKKPSLCSDEVLVY